MDLLPVYDFVTSWTGGLENVGNVGLLNTDTKVTFINIIIDLARKVYVLKSCQVHGANYKFS